jgi:hypothetical protein
MSGGYDVDYDSDCDVYDYDDDYIYADAGAYDLAVCRFPSFFLNKEVLTTHPGRARFWSHSRSSRPVLPR